MLGVFHMEELSRVNLDYLKKHYQEMMNVNDTPLPLTLLGSLVPETDKLMAEKIITEGRTSLYGRYRDNLFHHSGEDAIEESNRLLREFVQSHPEHSELLL